MKADAVVIGAGFAGLSAAVRLADAGLRVVVVEAAPGLGGRASTFTDPATGERVDNGQHVLFGCYRETYAFLRRLGTEGGAPLDRALTVGMAASGGRVSRLACPRLRPPWHLLAGVLRWDAIPLADRLTVLRLAPALRRTIRRMGARTVPRRERFGGVAGALIEAVGSGRAERSETVSTWLLAHGQSAELCRWLWHPLAVAALNQAPTEAAAGPFLRVLAGLFGPRPEDSAIGVPVVPLDELYARPAARVIGELGGRVLARSVGRICLNCEGGISAVRAGAATITTSAVVSAVPWHAVSGLWERACPPQLAELCAGAAAMRSSPIVTVNLWFDRPVMPMPFLGLVGGAMHWAFDKSAIFSRRAGHISLVSSGASDLVTKENEEVVSIAVADLGRALPDARAARLNRAVVVRERRATFSLRPGEPPRPGTETSLPGFVLAGDWVDTGLPATIEGAVVSGRAAADAVLALKARKS